MKVCALYFHKSRKKCIFLKNFLHLVIYPVCVVEVSHTLRLPTPSPLSPPLSQWSMCYTAWELKLN